MGLAERVLVLRVVLVSQLHLLRLCDHHAGDVPVGRLAEHVVVNLERHGNRLFLAGGRSGDHAVRELSEADLLVGLPGFDLGS